jgi:hypothetical protein
MLSSPARAAQLAQQRDDDNFQVQKTIAPERNKPDKVTLSLTRHETYHKLNLIISPKHLNS